ncbi:MAG TPA: 3-oxoacyl-[acyl-carrier-protein] synthase III C-terminal domain-containing protein, partial [Acidimicrobiales bacterium]
VFLGDSSGAAILQSERPARGLEVLDLTWRADNAHHAEVVLPRDGFFHMDGPKAKAWVQPALLSTAHELLERNGATPADLRGLVCHQANLRLLEWFADTLGVSADRHWHDVEWAGNTFASGAATSLAGGLEREADQLVPGDLVLAVTVGAGHNVVGALLRWVGP